MTAPTPEQVDRARKILPVFSRINPIVEVTHPDGSRHTLKSFYVDELETLIAQALADEAEKARMEERERCSRVAENGDNFA